MDGINIFRNVIITEFIIFSFATFLTIFGYKSFIKKLKVEKIRPIIFMIAVGFMFTLAFRDIGKSLPLEIYDYTTKQYIETEGRVEKIEFDSRNVYVYMDHDEYILPKAISKAMKYQLYTNDYIKIKYGKSSKYIVSIEVVE